MVYDNILKRLAQREYVTPFLENAMLADNWPESYQITIDSSEYYGRGDGYFHPSSHPLMGARQLYFHFHPDFRDKMVPQPRDLTSYMTLAMGSSLHGVVQTQFQMAGLCKPEDIEVEYVNKEHHVRGRADFIVNHPNGERIPVEMKTQNSRSFSKQIGLKPAWDAQLSLALDNLGYSFGILLVVEAGYPYHIKEFPVRRNDVLLSSIYEKFDYVREAIELNAIPPHCCQVESAEMKKCAARFECWLKEGS